MTLRAAVVRPMPANDRTAAALRELGVDVLQVPFFAVRPVAWSIPDEGHDALLLTSANAVRHAGDLGKLAALPVITVGAATAAAARAAGLRVMAQGDSDAASVAALARAHGVRRPLHLAGRHRVALAGTDAVTVYASEPLPLDDDAVPALNGRTVLLHSARAARRLATLPLDRSCVTLAAFSPAVRIAAGEGWRNAIVAERPTDAALVAAVARLAD